MRISMIMIAVSVFFGFVIIWTRISGIMVSRMGKNNSWWYHRRRRSIWMRTSGSVPRWLRGPFSLRGIAGDSRHGALMIWYLGHASGPDKGSLGARSEAYDDYPSVRGRGEPHVRTTTGSPFQPHYHRKGVRACCGESRDAARGCRCSGEGDVLKTHYFFLIFSLTFFLTGCLSSVGARR